MKKTLLFLSVGALLAACESGQKTTTDAPSAQEAPSAEANGTTSSAPAANADEAPATASTPEVGANQAGGDAEAPGAKLIAASDCSGCHKERDKLVGPAYTAVAAKYPSNDENITMLANKVIQGGKGHWGEVPMTAHPGLSLADAKEMTKYILSLK